MVVTAVGVLDEGLVVPASVRGGVRVKPEDVPEEAAGRFHLLDLGRQRLDPALDDLRSVPPRLPTAPGPAPSWRDCILEGLRYLRGRQVLWGAFLIDINAMVFGAPSALLPALAASVLHGGASMLGHLYAAPAAGALAGALTTGWLTRIRRQAWTVIVAVCVVGAAIAAFGLARSLWIALALLAVAGWADVISAVLRSTILQASAPEEFRSRISSAQTSDTAQPRHTTTAPENAGQAWS